MRVATALTGECGRARTTLAEVVARAGFSDQSPYSPEKLAREVQRNGDGSYAAALPIGYEVGGPTMVGSAIAKVGSKVVKVVARSGANAGTVLRRMPSNHGREVLIVGDNVPVRKFRTVTG